MSHVCLSLSPPAAAVAASARDDPAPLRDAVRQLLLRGQQAGDAQQGRLFLQRGAVVRAAPQPCQPFPPTAVFPCFQPLHKTLDDSLALKHLSVSLSRPLQ